MYRKLSETEIGSKRLQSIENLANLLDTILFRHPKPITRI